MDDQKKPQAWSPDQAQQLKQRIERFKASRQRKADPKIGRPLGMLVRSGIEILAGVLVGTLLGIGVDRWLSISPWGLIVGFLMGSVAGFWNIRRFLLSSSIRTSDKDTT